MMTSYRRVCLSPVVQPAAYITASTLVLLCCQASKQKPSWPITATYLINADYNYVSTAINEDGASSDETTYSVWMRGRRWDRSGDRRRCVRISSWLRRLVSSLHRVSRSTAGLHHSDGRGTARNAQPPVPIAISHSRPTLDVAVHSTHYTDPADQAPIHASHHTSHQPSPTYPHQPRNYSAQTATRAIQFVDNERHLQNNERV